jgi:hypothetical protein
MEGTQSISNVDFVTEGLIQEVNFRMEGFEGKADSLQKVVNQKMLYSCSKIDLIAIIHQLNEDIFTLKLHAQAEQFLASTHHAPCQERKPILDTGTKSRY